MVESICLLEVDMIVGEIMKGMRLLEGSLVGV